MNKLGDFLFQFQIPKPNHVQWASEFSVSIRCKTNEGSGITFESLFKSREAAEKFMHEEIQRIDTLGIGEVNHATICELFRVKDSRNAAVEIPLVPLTNTIPAGVSPGGSTRVRKRTPKHTKAKTKNP